MAPACLTLIGLALWVAVGVWNYRAKELTMALFWSRLIATVAGAFLFAISLYLLSRRQ